MSERTPVVIYASLSKKEAREDGKDRERGASIESQIGEVRDRLDEERFEISGPFSDDGFSGSKRNRGPDLDRAITASLEAAEAHGHAELWAVASSRFGRGSGRLGEARAVGALFYELRAQAVALRTVHDDEFVTNEMLIGFASRQASKYAEDLSAAVKRSKRRQAEAGERLGGPWPLGYRMVNGEACPDPAHQVTIERIFELAGDGVPDARLARAINAEGLRTATCKPFDRRAIQALVTNPTYAALVIHEGAEYDGDWQPLVDREAWRRIQAARGKRDLGAERHIKGRPAHRHLLAKLARCGKCGSPMFVYTSPYRRKDGTRARQYRCRGYAFSDGTCSMKVDAEAVDAAVVEHLPRVMPDFGAWIAGIEDRHLAERERLQAEVERAGGDRDHQARKAAAAERKWSEYLVSDEDKADTVLPMVERERQTLEQTEARLRAAEDALASVPEKVERDRLLDFASNLRAEIAGRVGGSHSVEQLNRSLGELFSGFTIQRDLPADTQSDELDDAVEAGGVYVFPNLRREVWLRLLAEHDEEEPEPPLEWMGAFSKPGSDQE
jgi:DNA invertase Pin-like site-specific DNA recombinase